MPMGCLASELGCKFNWEAERVTVQHPSRGFLPVQCKEGCPLIPRKLALDLIQEMEESKRGVALRSMDVDKEGQWLKDLVSSHPVLRKLPQHICPVWLFVRVIGTNFRGTNVSSQTLEEKWNRGSSLCWKRSGLHSWKKQFNS